MEIHAIRTEKDYEAALRRIESLMDAAPDSEEAEELDVLATLVEVYEEKHFPIENPDPVEAILFRLEQMGLDRKDLEPLLGSKGRVSEVLNRKRNLSIKQIRRLHDELRIPYDNLMGTS